MQKFTGKFIGINATKTGTKRGATIDDVFRLGQEILDRIKHATDSKEITFEPSADCVQYKHMRDLNKKLIATFCIISLPTGDKAIGISICSPMDNFCRKVGREKAYDRAKEALDKQISSNPVTRNKKTLAGNPALAAIGTVYKYLSIYIPPNCKNRNIII